MYEGLARDSRFAESASATFSRFVERLENIDTRLYGRLKVTRLSLFVKDTEKGGGATLPGIIVDCNLRLLDKETKQKQSAVLGLLRRAILTPEEDETNLMHRLFAQGLRRIVVRVYDPALVVGRAVTVVDEMIRYEAVQLSNDSVVAEDESLQTATTETSLEISKPRRRAQWWRDAKKRHDLIAILEKPGLTQHFLNEAASAVIGNDRDSFAQWFYKYYGPISKGGRDAFLKELREFDGEDVINKPHTVEKEPEITTSTLRPVVEKDRSMRIAPEENDFRRDLIKHTPQLRAFALKLTKNQHAADDLLHTTLEKAWRARDSFQRGSNFGAWTARILHNTFLSDVRSAEYKRVFSGEEAEDAMGKVASSGNQEIAMALKETFQHIEMLPPHFRAALIAVGIRGLSYDDASKELGVAVGTVKSQVNRARALLRQMRGDELEEDQDPESESES
jgi:RNA polymerase sigma-70 factor (ECF subfamily)